MASKSDKKRKKMGCRRPAKLSVAYLQRQNRLLVDILESIHDGFFTLDEHLIVTYFNKMAEDLLGKKRSQVLGLNLFESFPEGKGSVFEEKYRLALREKKIVTFEVYFAAAPYSNWYEVRVFPQAEGISVYFQVTTERHRAEEALRQSEAKFRAITEPAQDSMFSKDLERRYTFVNPATEKLLGLPASAILGKKPEDIFSPEACAMIREVDEKNFRGEVVDAVRILPVHGKDYHLHVIQVPLRDGQGNICGISGIVRDVTEAKTVEARRQQSQKMEAIGKLAGGIAHDFNNILASIIGFADLAGAGATPEFLEEILKAARRGKELVKQILTFSRQSMPMMQPLQTASIVAEAVKFLRASTPSTVDIRLDIAPDSGNILADPTQIYQLLINLCSNAVQAMQEKGTLQISLADANPPDNQEKSISHVRLSVEDSGKGIDKNAQEHIFEPFYTTKEIGKGTGLGLAVVHGIVKSHGGVIKVESEPGKGSVFHMFFPKTLATPSPAPAVVSSPCPSGGSILCVDDEEAIVKLLHRALTPLGYKITATTSSPKALELFRATPRGFDLVIMDQTMPQLDGAELAQKMLAVRPDLPIILCTGYSALVSPATLKKIGVKAFLMKPVERAELIEVIQKTLAAAKSTTPPTRPIFIK